MTSSWARVSFRPFGKLLHLVEHATLFRLPMGHQVDANWGDPRLVVTSTMGQQLEMIRIKFELGPESAVWLLTDEDTPPHLGCLLGRGKPDVEDLEVVDALDMIAGYGEFFQLLVGQAVFPVLLFVAVVKPVQQQNSHKDAPSAARQPTRTRSPLIAPAFRTSRR